MRIWITRAQPEAEATAERLRAMGHEPVVQPLLEVRPSGDPPDLAGVGALAFTSRNGVRAFAALSKGRSLPAFAVGDATAQAAREAGFSDVASASGDVVALAALIASRKAGLKGEVLHLAPAEAAGDLVGALAAQDVTARAHVVYRTVPAAPPEGPPGDIDVVLLHSAKAARRLADDPALAAAAPAMTAVCISTAAAEPLHGLGLREVLVAAEPREAAMLELFRAWAARQGPPKLFTPLYWAVVAFGLACIIGAILVAGLGPRLFKGASIGPAPRTAQPLHFRGNSG